MLITNNPENPSIRNSEKPARGQQPPDRKTIELLQNAIRLQQNGDHAGAARIYQQLIRSEPVHAEVFFHYGNFLWQANRPKEAAGCYQRTLELQPDHVHANGNLGAALWLLGEHERAIQYYKRVIDLDPGNALAYHNLGGAFYIQGKGDEAIQAFRDAIRLKPGYADAYRNLGNTYFEQGRYEEALGAYRKELEHAQTGGTKVRLVNTIPMIPASREHIAAIRRQLESGLDALAAENITIVDPVAENGFTNFFLAYHGENDRLIQEKYAQLYLQACNSIQFTAPHCQDYSAPAGDRKIRVGFISKNLMNHSIGNTSRGIIAKLSRELFEVVVLFLSPPKDETSRYIAQVADEAVLLPGDLAEARNRVAELKLDILFYQDTGLDPFTFFLAFSRLAPVQCTSFGHPVTTGIPALDYYISTELWEPEDADAHYTEQLVRLHDVASVAYYYRPPVPEPLQPREYFGLANEKHVYLCPQTLFKFHPDIDLVFAGILAADPQGLIVLIEGKHPHMAEILRARFKRTVPANAKRIIFLPRQSGADFINLIAVSDVMLDTLHFCGFNTTLQAFRTGTPVVTLPGKFMRGRHTLAFYRKIDYLEPVAGSIDEYIDIACRLGTDPAYRETVSRELLTRSEILWQEEAVISEFERFFLDAFSKRAYKDL